MSSRATPLTTRRSVHCFSCHYSSDIAAAASRTRTLVCPSCHQQGFIFHCLTLSSRTTTPPPATATTTANPSTTYTTTPPPTAAATTNPPTTIRPPTIVTTTTAAVQPENAISRENQGARVDDWLAQLTSSVSSRTKSTSKSFLKSLPSVRITAVDLKESSSCSICMEDFVFGASADKLPCKHLFHKSCIVKWLSRSNTCPLCRFELPVEPRTPVIALPRTRSENNLDGLRVSSSMSPGVIRRVTVIRTGRGFLGDFNFDRGASGSNTIGRGGGNSIMDRGGLGSNTSLDVVLDDDGDTMMIEDVQRDADDDIIMADA